MLLKHGGSSELQIVHKANTQSMTLKSNMNYVYISYPSIDRHWQTLAVNM